MTTPTTVPVRLQLRADTAANWTSVNPILLANELGRETDTGKIKIGNGTSTWTSLAYQAWATLPVAVNAGGTGQTSYTNGQLLIGNTTGNTLTKATLTAGSGVAITNGTGSITVAASGIANTNIAANAEIAVSKLQDGTARQLLQTAANGTDVEWASNIDIPGTLDVTGNAIFDANLTVQGDLTVNGTETIINTQTLTVEDKNIELGKITSPTDATADGGGITLKGTTDKTINWIDATDAWTLSEHVDLATGKEYRINGAQVLTGTALGSGVTSSSLTSVGTISSGTWQGTTVGTAYGGTGQTTYANGELLIGKTDGTLAKATLTAGTGVAVTNADGSVTVAVDSTVVTTAQTGTVTSTMIADGTIVDADVNASAAIAGTKISPNFGSQNVVTTGTSTAASLIPTGSSVPSNGVYLPAANSVGISTNGTGRLSIDSNGIVKINTTVAPLAGVRLTVQEATTGRAIELENVNGNRGGLLGTTGEDDATNGLLVNADRGGGKIVFQTQNIERMRLDSSGRFEVKGAGTAGVSPAFSINGSAPANSAVVDSSGRLGLGTSSPGQLLEIASASNPQMRFTDIGDYFYDIGITDSNKFTIAPAGTSALTVVAAGNVGIGTTGPLYPLDVRAANAGSTTYINVDNTSATATSLAGIYFSQNGTPKHSITAATFGADYMAFNIGAGGSITERARIDSSGRLLVGTSTARANFVNSTFSAALQVEGVDHNSSSFSQVRSGNNNAGAFFCIAKTRGSVGSNVLVANNDQFGVISFQGSDGSEFVEGAQIQAAVDGTPGANDMPGRLVFSTTAAGASSPTERMRIDNSGSILLGQTTTSSPGFGNTVVGLGYATSSNTLGLSSASSESLRLNRNSDGAVAAFRRSGAAGSVGTISVTTTATAYNTSSDYRLKENVVLLTDAIDRLQQIPVYRFNFIADPDTVVDGFLAHEAQEIVPECVTGTKDEVDEDGNPVYQGIDQSKLVPLLTAALQEALAKIETLEARLDAAGIS
jgi:hypothetical protein